MHTRKLWLAPPTETHGPLGARAAERRALLVWDASYELGVGQIDAEHRELAEHLNRLAEATRGMRDKNLAGGLLLRLIRASQKHFSGEEELMRATGYPAADMHRIEHKYLISRVAKLAAEIEAGGGAVTAELLEFLRDWLTGHIAECDTPLARFLARKGVR